MPSFWAYEWKRGWLVPVVTHVWYPGNVFHWMWEVMESHRKPRTRGDGR